MPVMAKLAAAPITWGVCEIPDWGTVPPSDQVLNEMASAGFRGTELGPPGFLPDNPVALRQALSPRGLRLVGAFCPLQCYSAATAAASLQEATHLAHVLAELECPFLVAADAGDERRREIAGRVGPADGLSDEAWRHLAGGLTRLADLCRPLGVEVVFHPHAGTYVETAADVDRLMDGTPADLVGLCLDTGHLAYGGADPVEVCRRYAARVRHVHTKDVRPAILERVRHEALPYVTAVGEGVFAPLGEGMVDFPALIAALRAVSYDGWYVLEQDIRLGPSWPAQNPLENARHSATYLEKLVGG